MEGMDQKSTHHHADPHFFSASFLFHGIIEDDVQEDLQDSATFFIASSSG